MKNNNTRTSVNFLSFIKIMCIAVKNKGKLIDTLFQRMLTYKFNC